MAAKANIVIDQGTTFSTTLDLTDDFGNIVDLTNYTAQGSVRKWYTSTNAVSFSVSIPQPNNGIISLTLDANTTAGLSYGRYVYDVLLIDGSNTITRIIEGIVTVTPEVTQLVNVSYGNYY